MALRRGLPARVHIDRDQVSIRASHNPPPHMRVGGGPIRLDIKPGNALKRHLSKRILAAPASASLTGSFAMDYSQFFSAALNRLHDERRYRVFADLERIAGRFPHAVWPSPKGARNVVIWCSNDYLGMGQHPKVVGAMVETATRVGTGAG